MSLRDRITSMQSPAEEIKRTWRDVEVTHLVKYRSKLYRLKPEIIDLVNEAFNAVDDPDNLSDELCSGLEFLFCTQRPGGYRNYAAWIGTVKEFADGPVALKVISIFSRDENTMAECQSTVTKRTMCINKDAVEAIM